MIFIFFTEKFKKKQYIRMFIKPFFSYDRLKANRLRCLCI